MRILTFPFLLLSAPYALALNTLSKEPSANGFSKAFRGWSSFPLQTYKVPNTPYGDHFLNAANITAQAKALAALDAGYNMVMIDSGWSANEGDANGRIVWDEINFPNFPDFVKELKDMGLSVGVYIVPGAFTSDIEKKKPIWNSEYTMGDINSPCTDEKVFPCKFLRTDLGFADEKQQKASQAWVQSVIDQFAEWDIDLIKFDYLHPKVALDGDDAGLPDGYSNANDVKAYHNAIASNAKGKKMWLLESYNLDTSENSLPLWRDTGDSYRLTTDINNSAPGDGTSTLVSWFAIQRAFEAMRIYISGQIGINRPLKGYPDLDSLIIGNVAPLNQINDDQRRTYMSLWIVTGIPIYLADDLTKLEPKHTELLSNKDMLAIYDDWTSAVSPAFFVNPDGSRNPSQLQIWEAGPFGDNDEVVIMLANMGCKENDRYIPPWDDGTTNCVKGKQRLIAGFDILQLDGEYCVHAVWEDDDIGAANDKVEWDLDEGQSVVLKLTPKAKAGGAC